MTRPPLAAPFLCVTVLAAVAGADDGVTIGQHSPVVPGGRAALHAHVDLPQPVGLEPSIFPGFPGFATGEFGFSNTQVNEVEDDLFTLDATADVSAVMTYVGGGLSVYDSAHLMAPGDAMHFGFPFFDYHPLFVLPNGGSGYVRFELRDASGTHADSDGFVLIFMAVNPACPGDIGSQGGGLGADLLLDNNDFIVFIDRFFAHDAASDRGSQGGAHAPDGLFDNNDFVVFIDEFFAGC